MHSTNGLKKLFLGLLFLVSACAQAPEIRLPGFHYLGKKVSLNVANIRVETQISGLNKTEKGLIPSSITDRLEHWAKNRFEARGSKGELVITLLDSKTFQDGLTAPEDIHVLFNSDGPEHFGVNALVRFEVKESSSYDQGETDVALKKTVTLRNDIKVAFKRRLWRQFVQNFMNSFDQQVMQNLKKYLPKLLG